MAAPLAPLADTQDGERWGPKWGFRQEPEPEALSVPILAPREPTPVWIRAMALLLALPEERVAQAYEDALVMAQGSVEITGPGGEKRTLLRTLEGDLDNCALANNEGENECQVCAGRCPDRDRIDRMRRGTIADAKRRLASVGVSSDNPFEELPDVEANQRTDEEDDLPF